MEETVLIPSNLKTTADYKTAIAHLLAEMDGMDERMDKNRARIEHLKIETQVIKAETEIIKARTATTLDRLKEQVHQLAGVA